MEEEVWEINRIISLAQTEVRRCAGIQPAGLQKGRALIRSGKVGRFGLTQ